MQDQAEKLRQLMGSLEPSPRTDRPALSGGAARVIAVTSGKGGVGKSNISVNLALLMAQRGRKVLLVDADMGLANVDVLLGIIPRYTLVNVLNGQKKLAEIVTEGPLGIRLVASGSGGVQELADLNEGQRNNFLQSLSDLQSDADVVLIDTGAGLHRNVLAFVLAAQEVLIVTTPEPTALMDAYGMIKVAQREKKDPNLKVLVNMANNQLEADEAGKKLVVLSKRFLNLDVQYLGYILRDLGVVKSVKEQKPLVLSNPLNPFAVHLGRVADHLLKPTGREEDLNLIHFFKKVTRLFGGKDND
ncbi:MAG TPA: MinD/ParA family protein [bacterium]|nr:MinD/ParA family protein [bacterium]